MRKQRPWWSPEGLVVSLLYRLGTELPGDARLIFAIAYGVVDCLGLKGATKVSYKMFVEPILKRKGLIK